MQNNIAENIKSIKFQINNTCKACRRNNDEIKLIAVSKKKSPELIKLAIENGITNFGENYAQELFEKFKVLESNNIIWHFIGPIQSNKIKSIAKCANWVHSLDREKIIRKLDLECKKNNKLINGCIQINVSMEDSKSGCLPEEMFDIAKLIESMKNIKLKGIMALPKLTDDRFEKELLMKKVKDLSDSLVKKYPNAGSISLGTTSDFEEAITHGSNMLRIGESIFGKRL
tara:strand:- start:1811 stop:2497 length:687 start_codon:yes stop_codon:yes gene_type:complete